MATKRWIGRAENISHIVTLTVGGTWVAGETATLTIGGAACKLTAGAAVTTSDIAAAIVAMVNGSAAIGTEQRTTLGSSLAQWSGIIATQSTNTVILTNTRAGVPFSVTIAETAAAGTVTQATTQQATGRNWLNNINNWSDGANPAAGDTIIFDDSDVSVLYGIDQITDTMVETVFGPRFIGAFGLEEQNSGGYQNYLPTYVTWRSTVVRIGAGPSGFGSGLIKIDAGAVQTSIYVTQTAAAVGSYSVQWKGTHASNLVVVDGPASFAAAILPDETSVIATLRVGPSADVYIGRGVSGLGTVSVSGGVLVVDDDPITSLTQTGGEVTINGSGGVTTYTLVTGSGVYNSTGTIASLVIGGGSGASIDFASNGEAKAVTAMTIKPNSGYSSNRNLTISGTITLDSTIYGLESR